jgi:phage gp29-like protein
VVRRDIATDDARRVSATLNRDLVKPLIDLNRGPRRRYPRISIGFNEKADLTELMAGLGPAVDRGLRVSEKWLRGQFGAPDPEPGEALLHRAEHTSAVDDSALTDRKEPSTVRNVQK